MMGAGVPIPLEKRVNTDHRINALPRLTKDKPRIAFTEPKTSDGKPRVSAKTEIRMTSTIANSSNPKRKIAMVILAFIDNFLILQKLARPFTNGYSLTKLPGLEWLKICRGVRDGFLQPIQQ